MSELQDLLQPVAVVKRISVSAESSGDGSDEQVRVVAQPEARRMMGFHRVPASAGTYASYKRSVGHCRPTVGSPVCGFDAVNYVTAPSPFRP